jgi:hypothetical protein
MGVAQEVEQARKLVDEANRNNKLLKEELSRRGGEKFHYY